MMGYKELIINGIKIHRSWYFKLQLVVPVYNLWTKEFSQEFLQF